MNPDLSLRDTVNLDSVLFVDDFRPYLQATGATLLSNFPHSSIRLEGDFTKAVARIKSEHPKILILNLHGPNGVAEGLDVLQAIVKSRRMPSLKIIINSGEHAAEIRDAFARSLQLLGPKGRRILDSVAIVVVAKGQEDLIQACKGIQSLSVPKRGSLTRTR